MVLAALARSVNWSFAVSVPTFSFAVPTFSFAVPSWLIPGTAADSARFLASAPLPPGYAVVEMGLCCFEGRSSLDAPNADYPAPGGVPLHVHLPTDLRWPDEAAALSLSLMARFAGLGVTRAVLHPPAGEQVLPHMAEFVRRWEQARHDPASLLLENHARCDAKTLCALLHALPVCACVDVAHLLAYHHEAILECVPPDRVGLLHWSAPGLTPGKDAHLPLTRLDNAQYRTARAAALRFAGTLPLVEVFSWAGICESLPVLRELYASA